jgi:glycosyltransferase involved in cell wall biosynthesis
MNVLQLNSYYISSGLYKNLYKNLSRQDVQQTIYVPVKNDADIGKNKIINLEEGNYIYSNTFNDFDRIIYYSKIKKIVQDMQERISYEQFDLIHAHSLFINGGVAYKLKQENNIDYITAVRSTDINVFFKYMFHLRNYGLKILKEAQKIIFISPAYKQKLINNYIPDDLQSEIIDKSIVIPNGINEMWLNNKYKVHQAKLNSKELKLLYVGQLIKRKNIEKTIQVAKILKKRGYNSNLTIVGKGKLRKKIKKIANKHENLIELKGYLSQKELIQVYRDADIFIMPSQNETFGLVYIEAMSQGLPIIYTKNDGIDGYFDNGEIGFAVNPDDSQMIANKVELILKDYQAKSKATLTTVDQFSWQDITQKYLKLYQKIRRS